MDTESGEVDISVSSVKPDYLPASSSSEHKWRPILGSISGRYFSLVQPEREGGNVVVVVGALDSFNVVIIIID